MSTAAHPPPQRLPHVDERSAPVSAGREETWTALIHVLRRSFGGAGSVARVLGCEPSTASAGFGGRVGETLPGFRVVGADAGRLLVLRGRHRFSEYELAFVLEDGRLRARTDAAFPGLHGKLYRAMVIGSGAHAVVTRRLLERTAGRAERSSDPPHDAGPAHDSGSAAADA